MTGKPVSHAFAKELLVGLAGAEIDKLIESKGLDYIDRQKAKRHARDNVENMYDQHYVRGEGAEEYDPLVDKIKGLAIVDRTNRGFVTKDTPDNIDIRGFVYKALDARESCGPSELFSAKAHIVGQHQHLEASRNLTPVSL
ncbi:hypothetical protein VTL71DRAFT_2026 [Oculimacula yallundae]|uniref:Uncharacterized protein n=1 Tax=Oculimacula yallundae TaxID=86028 RepID=A0ABR4CCD0_9HELO